MDVYIGNIGSGKTYEMVNRSSQTGEVLVVVDNKRKKLLLDQAKSMGLSIKNPLTYEECKRSHITNGLIIDDVENFISWLLGSEIRAITLSTPIKELIPLTRKNSQEFLQEIINEKEKEDLLGWENNINASDLALL